MAKKTKEKLTLVKTEYRLKAFKDNFGYPHSASVIVEQIEVEITKQSYGKGHFENKVPIFKVAKTSDNRIFIQKRDGAKENPLLTIRWFEITSDIDLTKIKGNLEFLFENSYISLSHAKAIAGGILININGELIQ